MEMTNSRVSTSRALLWIICLAFLSVGARNFELGLSSDAPLYATIARHIARTGEWFRLSGQISDFRPFVDHPHLGFWLVAVVFKVLPAADWSARIVGQLFYVAFLLLYFLYVRRKSTQLVAVSSVLLLWIWGRFSNFFSTVYLDPGALFFGSAAVFLLELALSEKRKPAAFVAGICVALCAMYKGLTVLGFLPTIALLLLFHGERKEGGHRISTTVLFLAGVTVPLALYSYGLGRSDIPDFYARYWQHQMTDRYTRTWNWWLLLGSHFWGFVLRDTYFLFPLALLALRHWRRGVEVWCPLALLVTFIAMYAPADRAGNQYLLMLMPWIAWLISEGILRDQPRDGTRAMQLTATASILIVLVLQYLPIRVHGLAPSRAELEVGSLLREAKLTRLWLDTAPHDPTFLDRCRFAWYSDLEIDEGHAEESPDGRSAVYLYYKNPEHAERLRKNNWCVRETFGDGTLWLPCGI